MQLTQLVTDASITSAYEIGRAGKDLMSLAVTSTDCGPALFLGSSAARVLPMLEEGLALCGSPVKHIDGGEIQWVTSRIGTSILIRMTDYSPNGDPESYALLEPQAVSAWSRAVSDLGQWLWPVPGAAGQFDLVTRQGLTIGAIVRHAGSAPSLLEKGEGVRLDAGQRITGNDIFGLIDRFASY